jgi:hypothetical protein
MIINNQIKVYMILVICIFKKNIDKKNEKKNIKIQIQIVSI